MIEQPLERKYSQVVNVLIFIFPIVINSLQVVGDIVLFLLAMMGLYIAFSLKLSPFAIKEIKVFSYISTGYFIAICLSVLLSGQALELAHYIPRDFYFLFAPFIALALYKAKININYLISGVKVSLLVIGMIVIYDDGERATGVMNAAVFGNLGVMLFFITLTFARHESIKQLPFTIFTLFLGIVAIIGSGTRGAWISLVLLLGAYVYFLYKQKTRFSKRSKFLTVIIIVLLASLLSVNQTVSERMHILSSEISSSMSGDQNPTSVGLRLNMYKKAINNIEDVPFFGYGYRTPQILLYFRMI